MFNAAMAFLGGLMVFLGCHLGLLVPIFVGRFIIGLGDGAIIIVLFTAGKFPCLLSVCSASSPLRQQEEMHVCSAVSAHPP
mmetsp:Transcript_25785/g.50798  ORF Transcript_25785/g.50798 Transcript_25785/m.50798 type:complete len:81 (+) Transcript_25785:526-768(+)